MHRYETLWHVTAPTASLLVKLSSETETEALRNQILLLVLRAHLFNLRRLRELLVARGADRLPMMLVHIILKPPDGHRLRLLHLPRARAHEGLDVVIRLQGQIFFFSVLVPPC